MKNIIFIDRDGTIIEEPPITQQVNSLQEMVFLPNVIHSLKKLYQYGFELIIVTNQDNLGTPLNPFNTYNLVNTKMLEILSNEGIQFSHIFECPHSPEKHCDCRKPKIGLVQEFLQNNTINKDRSFMIGDRKTDLDFASNIGIKGFLLDTTNWEDITHEILFSSRKSHLHRKTDETSIYISLNLDGNGKYSINTGLKFFDHMLEQLSKHGKMDLEISCLGDLEIDEHHTIEDVAITLGQCFKKALDNKIGIERYAWERILIMDEAKTEISLDLSGRSYLVFNGRFTKEYVGDFPTEMLHHFLHSFCYNAGINMHVTLSGDNTHHIIECCFKALAKCLRDATQITNDTINSTKGIL